MAVNPPRVVDPVTGATIVLHFRDLYLYVDNDATLAELTVKLPNAPYRGDIVMLTAKSEITTLVVQDGAGGAISGSPTTIAAGETSALQYINRTIGWKTVLWA